MIPELDPIAALKTEEQCRERIAGFKKFLEEPAGQLQTAMLKQLRYEADQRRRVIATADNIGNLNRDLGVLDTLDTIRNPEDGKLGIVGALEARLIEIARGREMEGKIVSRGIPQINPKERQ
jgi:hypothetical protein